MSESQLRQGRVKYPKTWHLPWSESESSDDHWLANCQHFVGKRVVVTEKLDGENTSLYSDYIHARSIDSGSHPCRTRMRGTWGKLRHEIPNGWRLAGENMEAAHSIWYLDLEDVPRRHSLFYCFGIYDENNQCLSWADTESYCDMLELHQPPVLYRGLWDEKIQQLWHSVGGLYNTVQVPDNHQIPPRPWEHYINPYKDGQDHFLPMPPTGGEGYVVRLEEAFPYDRFSVSVAKFVRRNHVQTDGFWMEKPVLPNLTEGSKMLKE